MMERSWLVSRKRADAEPDDEEPEPSGLRGFETWAPLGCALLAAAVAAAMLVGTRDFALDDAWIHLAYAKSARLGDGLSYNPGDWETGVSSPLWVLLISLWPVSGEPVLPVKLLGVLLHAATAWAATDLVFVLVRQRASIERPRPLLSIGLLGGVVVATTPTLVVAATSGMEVPLAALLLLLTARAMVAGSPGSAAALAAAATLARPEAMFFIMASAATLAVLRWRGWSSTGTARTSWWAAAGSLAALVSWFGYCQVVSGYPLPNTQVIKGGFGDPWAGLDYVAVEVLPFQPWLVSLTGLGLIALALLDDRRLRRAESWALAVGYAVLLLATALSRPLHVGVQFYESRYFAIVAAVPMLLAVVGASALASPGPNGAPRRWALPLAFALVLPMGLLSAVQVGQLRKAAMEASDDTYSVHTSVARFVAAELPPDAVVGVEGAGAIRFFAPRSMTVVDLVGLNDHTAAHLHHDRTAKSCYFVGRQLTHLVVPTDWIPAFAPLFELRGITSFVDPRYTQVSPPRPLEIAVLEIVGVREDWARRCR